MKMLSQVTAFISDLKLGFKSSTKGSYKSRRRRQGDDDDDSAARSGCLGRSVSMEWGLASRRRRTKSTESLDRMSDHVRSAVSLMELTQASQARPVPGEGGAGAGTTSSTTSDTWSSSNSSGHASSNSRRTRQQRYHDDANRQPSVGGLSSRDQKHLHYQSGSTPNRHTNARTASTPHQICLPPPPPRSAVSTQRRPSSLATQPTAFNSVPRQRSRRKNHEDPLTGRIPSLTPRKTDVVDGATITPGTERTPARIPDAQTNGAKAPLVRKILPLTVSGPVGTLPVSNGSGTWRVEPKPDSQINNHRGLDAALKSELLLECVIDTMNGAAYYKGKLLGKGGFAKCYELNDIQSPRSYAGKIISKTRLTKDNQKDKILREVELHRSLQHRNVVKFHSYFEDDHNVYIVLENCSRKSLVHILKHRKTLTEPEVRYYMHSLVNGLSYVHGQHVIHRDLKLGNMLLNEQMELKIADFGLATKVEYEGEKKMTVCGTPNYIAPEVLQKKGHSYEADIWALGCIMYALLCGRPPFETNTLKETYMRIVANKFILPPHVSMTARELICRLLTLEPSMRPSLTTIQAQDFFSDGHFPTVLSATTCETRPKFPVSSIMPIRKPKAVARTGSNQMENSATSSLAQSKGTKKSASQIITRNKTSDFEYTDSKFPEGNPREAGSAPSIPRDDLSNERINAPGPDSEVRLYRQLLQSIETTSQSNKTKPEDGANGFGQMMTPSRFKTTVCVTKWVDYSNKYGFGFQLSNNSIGILFNDSTRMLLDPDGTTIELNDPNGGVTTFTQDSAPVDHEKKVTLLLYFAQYMDTHLISGGQLQTKVRYMPVFLKRWFRTDRAIVMFLTDGTLQVNFLEDHTKVIFNPDGAQDFLLTLVNSNRQATTYPLKALRHFGCSAEVLDRLRYASSMLERTISVEGVRV